MTDKNPNDMTVEEQLQYVSEKIRHAICDPETAEDVLAGNDRLLRATYEVLWRDTQEAIRAGVKVHGSEIVARYRFDADLGVGRLQSVEVLQNITLPHPVKRLVGFYKVDPSFFSPVKVDP